MQRRTFISLILTALMGLPLAGGAIAQDKFIVLASTTSTEASGLFEYLLPMFQKKTGVEVRVVAVGSGEALELGRNGDADALLVHHPEGEQEYMQAGYGIDRRDLMYNDFIIVGPKSDPAGIEGMKDALVAYKSIAESESPFASRGDDSGTHAKELLMWEAAGIEPEGEWYRELGTGMGETLNTAAGMDAYTMTDRGTWANFGNRQNLVVLVEGDPELYNPYSTILVNPRRHPHIKIDLARRWHQWLTSEEGQQAIADYEIGGQQLFFPTYEGGE
ncbi:MAG: substrate-binding domain-containing protein [Gammaproteobacteria bacterium]